MLQIILFFVGFFFLIKGSKALISGATTLAKIFSMPEWIIGLVIVGIGTSIPEFSINLASVFSGAPGIGLGTIIGSNTFNILVIIGLVAIISPIKFNQKDIEKDLLINVAVVFLAILFAIFPILGDSSFYGISRSEGVVLSILFLLWLLFQIGKSKENVINEGFKNVGFGSAIVLIVFGIIGVFLGGSWVVSGAERIASFLGISRSIIGLTLVGIGTSLPELSVSISAAIAGKRDIAVGNIIGSNIFDFLGILGIVSVLKPIPFVGNLSFDILFTAFATLLLFSALYVGKRYVLGRGQGFLFLFIYLAYLLSIIFL